MSLGIAGLKSYVLQWSDIRDCVEITVKVFKTGQMYYPVMQHIEHLHPDVVGLSCYVWNFEHILHVASLVKSVMPHAYIIVGGPQATVLAEEIIQRNRAIDVVVRGSGEEPFTNLLRHLMSGSPKQECIQGLVLRKGAGVFTTPAQPAFDNLEAIPPVYSEDLMAQLKKERVSKILYESSKGCLFSCHYCYYDGGQKRAIRAYPLERVKEELSFFIKCGLERVTFVDSFLNFDRDRFLQILQFILRHNRNTRFEFTARGDLLDREGIRLLNALAKRKYLFRVEMGLQSIHRHVLKKINRTLDLRRLTCNASLFQPALREVANFDLMYGLPGDTYKGFKTSLEYSLRRLGNVHCMALQVLPGTHLYTHADAFRLVHDNLPPYYLYSNDTYSLDDMIRSENLTRAYYVLFATFARQAVIVFAKAVHARFVDIFEEFVDWEHKRVPAWEVDLDYSYARLSDFFKEACFRYGRGDLFPAIEAELRSSYAQAMVRKSHGFR